MKFRWYRLSIATLFVAFAVGLGLALAEKPTTKRAAKPQERLYLDPIDVNLLPLAADKSVHYDYDIVYVRVSVSMPLGRYPAPVVSRPIFRRVDVLARPESERFGVAGVLVQRVAALVRPVAGLLPAVTVPRWRVVVPRWRVVVLVRRVVVPRSRVVVLVRFGPRRPSDRSVLPACPAPFPDTSGSVLHRDDRSPIRPLPSPSECPSEG